MKKTPIKTLTPLVKTHYLSMYDAAYTNNRGDEKHWMVATRKSEEAIRKMYFSGEQEDTDAVMLVARHEPSGKLVLIRQFRMPLNDFIYELPAGLIDNGDDLASTIARELKEETGLILKDIRFLQDKLYMSPGMTDESIALAYCTCEGTLSTAYLEADEVIEPLLVSKEEAKVLLESKAKLDMKLFLILQQFVYGELYHL